jgi:hypothetical protein
VLKLQQIKFLYELQHYCDMVRKKSKLTAADIARLPNWNNRQKSLWFAGKARKELNKKKPNYAKVNYCVGQAKYDGRLRPVFAFKKKAS